MCLCSNHNSVRFFVVRVPDCNGYRWLHFELQGQRSRSSEGQRTHILPTSPKQIEMERWDFTFSPDGHQIVWTSSLVDLENTQIWSINVNIYLCHVALFIKQNSLHSSGTRNLPETLWGCNSEISTGKFPSCLERSIIHYVQHVSLA